MKGLSAFINSPLPMLNNTNILLDFVLGSNVVILAAVLTLVARYFQGERGQRLEATLETIDSGLTTGANHVEDAYEKLKFQYGELKELYLRYKAGAQDGVSLDDAQAVGEDLKQLVDNVDNILPKTT